MSVGRNLLIVLAHGLRSDALSDVGAWPLRTPNFDNVARRGLRLIASAASTADPGAAVSLLTGLHARQHGYVDPLPGAAPVRGWPALLADAGYHVAGVGCVGAIEAELAEAVCVAPPDELGSPRCAYLSAIKRTHDLGPLIEQRRQRRRAGLFDPMTLPIVKTTRFYLFKTA